MSKEESIRSVICGNLNRLLNERRMTQKELSDFMGVSASTVNDWVRGKKIPRMDKVDKLCSIFGVSREEILYDHSSRTNP
ncbi:MAG TPA: XRE family transcriptional regulator, partial [Selenomonas sp.]|nr:XRE family transcriptional regulator [Selenomonas sp.]